MLNNAYKNGVSSALAQYGVKTAFSFEAALPSLTKTIRGQGEHLSGLGGALKQMWSPTAESALLKEPSFLQNVQHRATEYAKNNTFPTAAPEQVWANSVQNAAGSKALQHAGGLLPTALAAAGTAGLGAMAYNKLTEDDTPWGKTKRMLSHLVG